MRVQWLLPSASEVRRGQICSGDFFISDKLDSPTPYTVVRDKALGFNMVRVDWTPEELELPTKERALIMDNMRMLVEIKYNQLKDNDGTTL